VDRAVAVDVDLAGLELERSSQVVHVTETALATDDDLVTVVSVEGCLGPFDGADLDDLARRWVDEPRVGEPATAVRTALASPAEREVVDPRQGLRHLPCGGHGWCCDHLSAERLEEGVPDTSGLL